MLGHGLLTQPGDQTVTVAQAITPAPAPPGFPAQPVPLPLHLTPSSDRRRHLPWVPWDRALGRRGVGSRDQSLCPAGRCNSPPWSRLFVQCPLGNPRWPQCEDATWEQLKDVSQVPRLSLEATHHARSGHRSSRGGRRKCQSQSHRSRPVHTCTRGHSRGRSGPVDRLWGGDRMGQGRGRGPCVPQQGELPTPVSLHSVLIPCTHPCPVGPDRGAPRHRTKVPGGPI